MRRATLGSGPWGTGEVRARTDVVGASGAALGGARAGGASAKGSGGFGAEGCGAGAGARAGASQSQQRSASRSTASGAGQQQEACTVQAAPSADSHDARRFWAGTPAPTSSAQRIRTRRCCQRGSIGAEVYRRKGREAKRWAGADERDSCALG